MLMQRFIFQSQQSEQHGGDEKRRGEAGRDKAIALHCQSGEAINNSVTIKRERGSECEGARVGFIKETQQNPVRRVLHLAGH